MEILGTLRDFLENEDDGNDQLENKNRLQNAIIQCSKLLISLQEMKYVSNYA